MRSVMVDLETLSLDHNAIIASIGAVEFGNDHVGREFHIKIDIEDCERYGMKISASTVAFWMAQDSQAQSEIIGPGRHSLASALEQFSDWLTVDGLIDDFEIWVLGDKDIPWLGNAYKAIGKEVPWHYWDAYDYRILTKFTKEEDLPPSNDKGHNSLEDCRWQIKFVQNYCKRNKLNVNECGMRREC